MASSELSLLATFLLCLLCTLPSIYKAITTRLQRYHLDNKLNLADSTATATPSPDINEVAVEKESPFSRDWFTSPSIYKLERRAVFSTNWHNVTHISNLPFPGSYLTPPPIGGYPIFLIRGKDDTVRAFHNVCRHRAYEVTRKECGKSLVLGCRYHGWSYDTKGKLVKAPEFEGVEGFSKDANSLWEIATRMRDGSIEVCLDSTMRAKGEKRLAEWKIEGNFNWKLVMGAFHDISLSEPATVWSQVKNFIISPKEKTESIWPLTTIRYSSTSSTWLTIKLYPQSATNTTIQCELHGTEKNESSLDEAFVDRLKETVQTKITALEATQTHISSSEKSSVLTESQTTTQQEILNMLNAHLKRERLEGKEIHPAARTSSFTEAGRADDDLCRELELSAAKERKEVGGSSNYNSLEW